MRLTAPGVAALAIAATGGCAAPAEVVLTLEGEASGAVTLSARTVDGTGPQASRTVGSASNPVRIPATIHLRVDPQRRIGLVAWLENAEGEVVGLAETVRCFDPGPGSGRRLTIGPRPEGWSPTDTNRCRCPANLGARMCPETPLPVDAAAPPDAATPAPDAATSDPPDAGPPDSALLDAAAG